MRRDYSKLINNIEARSNPEGIILEKALRDDFQRIPQEGVFMYIKKAMQAVDPAYTARSKEAGNKVRQWLKNGIDSVSFEYQGSVMTNTHIKGFSDIDLLVICEDFYTFDREGIAGFVDKNQYSNSYTYTQIDNLKNVLNGGGYTGALADLRRLRLKSEDILTNAYSHVNIEKSKSIKVELTNPRRDVDIVIANWYDNTNYYLNKSKELRGIKVFSKGIEIWQDKQLDPDYPFLSIYRINEKDKNVNGRLKKMIRFLKNVKGDSSMGEEVKLTSFDFNAICYDIKSSEYSEKDYLSLVPVLLNQLQRINNDSYYRFNLLSVDGREFVFRNEDQQTENTEKVAFVRYMMEEINSIAGDLLSDLKINDLGRIA